MDPILGLDIKTAHAMLLYHLDSVLPPQTVTKKTLVEVQSYHCKASNQLPDMMPFLFFFFFLFFFSLLKSFQSYPFSTAALNTRTKKKEKNPNPALDRPRLDSRALSFTFQ